MAYLNRELIDIQNPTKGKIYITISNKMDLLLHVVPSLGEATTDGKCYDYEKEIVTSLTLKECIQLMHFADAERLSAAVSFVRDIQRKGGYLSKKISFEYIADKSNPTKIGYVVIKSKESSKYMDRNSNLITKNATFDIPLNKDEMIGLKYVLSSYVNNYTALKCDYFKEAMNNNNTYYQQGNQNHTENTMKEEESRGLFS